MAPPKTAGLSYSCDSTPSGRTAGRERFPGLDLDVLLEPALLSVHEHGYLGREPGGPDGAILVEADVGDSRRVALAGLEQSDEQQPVAIDPELLRVEVPGLRAHDVDRAAVPGVLVNGGKIETSALQPCRGPLDRIDIHVEP